MEERSRWEELYHMGLKDWPQEMRGDLMDYVNWTTEQERQAGRDNYSGRDLETRLLTLLQSLEEAYIYQCQMREQLEDELVQLEDELAGWAGGYPHIRSSPELQELLRQVAAATSEGVPPSEQNS